MYHGNSKYISNIKEINSVNKPKLDDTIYATSQTDGKKRNLHEIDNDNPITPPSIPSLNIPLSSSQIEGDKMDIDNNESIYNSNQNEERPLKKKKELEKDTSVLFDEQYRRDKYILDHED
jgi:hypothetical protein